MKKKLLFVLPLATLLCGCELPFLKTEEKLPDPVPEESQTPGKTSVLKSVKLTKSNDKLTTEDSTGLTEVSLAIEDTKESYVLEIGPNCWNHSKYEEICMKDDAYIKSKSNFVVNRLVIDYMSKNGANFAVKAGNDEVITAHESSTKTEFSGDKDYGAVLEYPINGSNWSITCTSTEYKTFLYSVTVIFTIEI